MCHSHGHKIKQSFIVFTVRIRTMRTIIALPYSEILAFNAHFALKKKRQRLFEYGWFSCRMHLPLEKLNFTNFHTILITMVFTTDYLRHHHPDFRKSHSASIEIAPLLQIIIIQFKETFKRQSDLTTSHSNLIHSIIPN